MRRQVYRLAADRDGALLEVDHQLADLDHRLGGRRRAAQHRAQPREQLVDADRLRHVVVGAGVERRHLLVLVADRREHDHRCRGPRAQLAADVDAGAVRQHEVEDHRVRRAHRRRRERRLGGVGRLDLVAGAAQARPQRAQDLRLVVDDEHARAALTLSASTRRLRRAARATNVAPCPARDSTATPAAVGLRETARDREPEAGAARPRRCARRDGTARRCARARRGGMPGPWSITRTIASDAVAATCTRTGSPGGEYLSAFSIRLTSTRRIWLGSTRTDGASSGSATSTRAPRRRARRARRRRGRRPRTAPARARPRLPGAARGRADSTTRRSSRSRRRPRSSRAARARPAASRRDRARASAAGRGRDRHQRRPQVVADGPQQRGLHRVRTP